MRGGLRQWFRAAGDSAGPRWARSFLATAAGHEGAACLFTPVCPCLAMSLSYVWSSLSRPCGRDSYVLQIEGEFPELLPIKESLRKYVFEPNAAKVRVAVRA